MMMAAFWDVALCSVVSPCCGGSKHVRNFGRRMGDYAVQYPGRFHTHRCENIKSHKSKNV
jgi:hypothetical protein